MKLVTWNIQWGLGCDGSVDLRRIRDTVLGMADVDVACLQEVANNFSGLHGTDGGNQSQEIARLFKGYTAIDGIATEMIIEGQLHQFGNMILSRMPVLAVFRHLLPRPADPGNKSMQRMALEVIVESHLGPLRIITVHLESYSEKQRLAQARRVRELYAEACARALTDEPVDTSLTPFRTAPPALSTIIAGDFNSRPSDAVHVIMSSPFGDGVPNLLDAWKFRYPDTPHPPTFGLAGADSNRFPDAPLCFDYLYATRDIARSILEIRVNSDTRASDHQPLLLATP